MNPNNEQFYQVLPADQAGPPIDPGWQQFAIGQVLEVNGVRMRVHRITRKDVVLRPVRKVM